MTYEEKRDILLESMGFDMDSIYYTEAVFKNGKNKVKPLLDIIKEAQDPSLSRKEILALGSKFSKELTNVFGFAEAYYDFEEDSKRFDDIVYTEIFPDNQDYDRYFIEGSLTDSGFYDTKHKYVISGWVSTLAMQELTAEEVLALILQTIGCQLDPAYVDIRYTQTNVLTKYLSNRKHKINNGERKVVHSAASGIVPALVLTGIIAVFAGIGSFFTSLFQKSSYNRNKEKQLEKLKKALEKSSKEYGRNDTHEAYGDNFARMYGYGIYLASAIKKIRQIDNTKYKIMQDIIDDSWYNKEKRRHTYITDMTISAIKNEPISDVHRIKALIKAYEEDINDKKTDPKLKKCLRQDKEELEKILDLYLNNFDEFQNRINNMINEELEKADIKNISDDE